MICTAKQLKQNETASNRFTDNIPAWAKGAVGAVVDAGYLSGYQDGTFGANKGMTRAEAVSALERMITAEEHTQQAEIKQQAEKESQQKETEQQNETKQQSNMVWEKGGGGGGSSKKSNSTTEQESNIITKDITIYNQKDADKLQKKTVLGKTTIYLNGEIKLQDVEFKDDVEVVIVETAEAYMTEDTAVPLTQRDNITSPVRRARLLLKDVSGSSINVKPVKLKKVELNLVVNKSLMDNINMELNNTSVDINIIQSAIDKFEVITKEKGKLKITNFENGTLKAEHIDSTIIKMQEAVASGMNLVSNSETTVEIEDSNIDDITTIIPEEKTTIKTIDSTVRNITINGENGESEVLIENSNVEFFKPQTGTNCTVKLDINSNISKIITGVDTTISGDGVVKSVEKTNDSVKIDTSGASNVEIENKPTEIKTVALTGLQDLTLQTAATAKVTTSDTSYSIGAVTWTKDNVAVNDWTTAQAGEYQASVTLTAKENYQFAKTTAITLNGTALTDVTIAEDGKTVTAVAQVTVAKSDAPEPPVDTKTEIKTVALTGLQDLTLQTAATAKVTTSDTGYHIGTVTWTKDDVAVNDWTTAQTGGYTASVTLTADSEYKFAPTSVTLNETDLTSQEYTCAEDGSTLTITKEVNIVADAPVINSFELTIPEQNQGTVPNSVVVDQAGTSIDLIANVKNATAGSKVRFFVTPNAETTIDNMSFSNGTVESTDNNDDIVTQIDVTNNSAETSLTINHSQKANFTIKAQYVDENDTIVNETEKTIDVIVINNPIDYIIIDSVSATTPVVGETIEELPTSSVVPPANKGYAVTAVEWGTWNDSFEALDPSHDTFQSGNTYAIKATFQVDSNISNITFTDSISKAQVGGFASTDVVSATKNGENVEIVIIVEELK